MPVLTGILGATSSDLTRSSGHLARTSNKVIRRVVAAIRERVGDGPVYRTFDLDVPDLASAPVVSDPEARGIAPPPVACEGVDRIAWDQRYRGRELVWASEPNRFLVSESSSLAPARAIDLACGEGRNAVWLAERGWEVTGVDFSSVGIEKARQPGRTRRSG